VDSGTGVGGVILVTDTLIENCMHEGVALSNTEPNTVAGTDVVDDEAVSSHKTVVIKNTAIQFCQQGVEVGFSTAGLQVAVQQSMIAHCTVGVRYGDSYGWQVSGYFTVQHTAFANNRQDWVVLNGVDYHPQLWHPRLVLDSCLFGGELSQSFDARSCESQQNASVWSIHAQHSLAEGLCISTRHFGQRTGPLRLAGVRCSNVDSVLMWSSLPELHIVIFWSHVSDSARGVALRYLQWYGDANHMDIVDIVTVSPPYPAGLNEAWYQQFYGHSYYATTFDGITWHGMTGSKGSKQFIAVVLQDNTPQYSNHIGKGLVNVKLTTLKKMLRRIVGGWEDWKQSLQVFCAMVCEFASLKPMSLLCCSVDSWSTLQKPEQKASTISTSLVSGESWKQRNLGCGHALLGVTVRHVWCVGWRLVA
jgi:hypothetical protein